MSRLVTYIDFKSPAAYLAVAPTLKLAAALNIEIEWRTVRTKQSPLPTEALEPGADRGEQHRYVRALARRDQHLFYAEQLGVPMTFPDKPGDTDLALAAATSLADPLAFILAAFKAYWVRGEDLNDPNTVQALADSPDLGTIDVAAVLAEIDAEALDNGIIDAPAYWIDGELFIGREHLPWVQELLSAN